MKHLSLALLILLATTGCKKEEKPSLASLHTKNLGGERTWKVTHSYFPLQYGNDTTYSLNDTSFAIQVLGDTKIKVFRSEMINKNQQYGQPIDTTKIEAVFKDGVLRLTLPKAAPSPAAKINVKAA